MYVDYGSLGKAIVATLAYCMIGIIIFGASFVVMNLLSPFSIRKEIEDDHNTALAILIGSVIIGLSIIIAAAVGG